LLSVEELTSIQHSYNQSNLKKMAATGKRYYNTENDIMKRKLYIYTENRLIEDPYKANNKIPSDYYKLLVDQCVSYLIGKNPKTGVEDENFHTLLIDISKKAIAQGVQWVHPYIKDGELKFDQMESEQMFPRYDGDELIEMFRFYIYDGKEVIERYTKNEKETYIEHKLVETKGHMKVEVTKGTQKEAGYMSWGMVPFIPLKYNKDCIYDLKSTKAMIDNYDKIMSDFANNLEDNQDIFWILKGFNGNLAAFTEQVKMYKSIPVGDTGDVKAETVDIPYEARTVALDTLENLIFKFGRGVNIEKMAGGSLTNVHIKSMFANLDMKANDFSIQIKEFILMYIDFYNIYAAMFSKNVITDKKVKFEKSIIINENENLETNREQYGVISEQTRLENHAWVDDVEKEIGRLEEIKGMGMKETKEE